MNKFDMNKFDKIRLSNVKSRPQYYLRCSKCGAILEGNDAHYLVATANFHGWVYDYEHDLVLCDDCQNKEEVTS